MKPKRILKPLKIVLWILFILYIFVVYRLIIWKGWGGFSYISQCYSSTDILKQSVLYSLNIVPLRFIFDIQGYTPVTWCKNVIGNFILFVPMGFFTLSLFQKVRAWSTKKYVLTMAALVTGIEIFQLLFMCGQCDIDDFILNLSGAWLGRVTAHQTFKMRGSPGK